jgi:exodeoxyribonuclease VII small subunit
MSGWRDALTHLPSILRLSLNSRECISSGREVSTAPVKSKGDRRQLTASERCGSLAPCKRGQTVVRKKQGVDFEASLEELEGLVERMEEGELSLEESLKTYERGIALSRACQKSLDTAEQRIQILSEKDGAEETRDFQPDDD